MIFSTSLKLNPKYSYSIITTKQAKYIETILSANQITLPQTIYDLNHAYGNKLNVLERLILNNPNDKIHFVEDRLETLLMINKSLILSNLNNNIQLYFADWGYNTHKDHEAVRNIENIKLIGS